MGISRKVLFTSAGLIAIAVSTVRGQTTTVLNPTNASAVSAPAAVQSAQTSSAGAPAFEVAAVRLVPVNKSGFVSISPWGLTRFTATNANLRVLIELAFGVEENQILGAPNWLGSQEYDIDAKAEGEKGLTYEETKPVLQQLLKDRFHLIVHREMKDFQGYALVVAKNGPKLQTSKGNSGKSQVVRGQVLCLSCPPQVLAGVLAHVTRRPIADETGIKGNYDIKLDYAPEDDPNSFLPSIFTALQEQLGLKLEKRMVPVEILVIDHVDRVPTEN